MSDHPLDVRNLAFGDIEHEFNVTRSMLERVPEEHFDWRPHERSWSLSELACHIVDLFWWHTATLTVDRLDMAEPWPKTNATTNAELMAVFETKSAELRATLSNLSTEALAATWTLCYGDSVILQQSRASVQRIYCISHLAHHRGQLTVYLRMLDVPLPPSYGPTADQN